MRKDGFLEKNKPIMQWTKKKSQQRIKLNSEKKWGLLYNIRRITFNVYKRISHQVLKMAPLLCSATPHSFHKILHCVLAHFWGDLLQSTLDFPFEILYSFWRVGKDLVLHMSPQEEVAGVQIGGMCRPRVISSPGDHTISKCFTKWRLNEKSHVSAFAPLMPLLTELNKFSYFYQNVYNSSFLCWKDFYFRPFLDFILIFKIDRIFLVQSVL